jgi:hypothetical protein
MKSTYVAHFVFLRDVWVRTQRAAVSRMRATKLATYLPMITCSVGRATTSVWVARHIT